MKFSVNANEMKAAMSLVNKAIAGKPTLPIMSCVKLEQDADGNLTLTGGSEGTFMTLTVPMFEVQDFHPVCIEAAILSDTLGTLGKQNATFQVDGTSATLVYSTGHFNVAVQSTDEYPTVQDNIGYDELKYQAVYLAIAVSRVRELVEEERNRHLNND